MAMPVFSIPIPWRDANHRGLNGVVEVSNSDFCKQKVKDVRVSEFIAMINKKLQDASSSQSTEHEVVRLMLHGVKLSSRYLLVNLVPEMIVNSPRFVVKTRTRAKGASVVVFVKVLTGKTISIECESMDTVHYVKSRIEDKCGIPTEDQRIMYAGRQLRDPFPLSFYNVANMGTLHVSMRLLGGFNNVPVSRTFADVSDTSLITPINFDPSAPEWRRCSRGLNIEGRCQNRECCAYRRMIIDRKHFEMFNLIRDDNIRCPMCGCKVKPITCGLYDCDWRYDGVKAADKLSISSQWQNAEGYVYYRFAADETDGSVEWASLLMVVKRRSDSVTVNTAQVSTDDECPICWSPFGSPVKHSSTMNRCGHYFHRACSDEWAKWCKHNHTQPSCPICRRTV